MTRSDRAVAVTLAVILALVVAPTDTLAQGSRKFAAWSKAYADAPIPLQTNGTDPRLERQAVVHDGAGNVTGVIFAKLYPGHLYVFGDEPDQSCVSPEVYAERFHSFVQDVSAVDPTARFSPAGFAQQNDACGGTFHFTAYAQAFYDAYTRRWGPPPVAEWRFHYFPDPNNLAPFFNALSSAAAWSVEHGAPMVLGSVGFPGYPALDVRPQIEQIMSVVDADPRIVAAVWWTYDWYRVRNVVQAHSIGLLDSATSPRELSADGETIVGRANAHPSKAGSGASALADFNGDGRADFADVSTTAGNFFVHVNRGEGGGRYVFDADDWNSGAITPGTDWTTLNADFTGDGLADVAEVHVPTNTLYVHRNLGQGRGFDRDNWAVVSTSRTSPDWEVLAGDFDGDGLADLVEHQLSTGLLWVRRNGGAGAFDYVNGGTSAGRTMVGPAWRTVVANFTGTATDRRADFADVNVATGEFVVHENRGPWGNQEVAFSAAPWASGRAGNGAGWQVLFGDFTGDGFADYADLSVSTGEFYIHAYSNGGYATDIWGMGGATARPGWQILGVR